tara:strand:+ start:7585 stop:8967 length:1383 start_codon:yes stop_codon:yes gene_type:complete
VSRNGDNIEPPTSPKMPIFTRRRIQQMLDDLVGIAAPSQFIGRLNDKRFENALPAEAELALVWAASRLGGFESEPKWYSPEGRLPEGISTALIPGHETVFDVKAVSDRVIPGVAGMRTLSAKLVEAANRARKGAGKNLCFFFYERRDYQDPKLHRSIYASPNHVLGESALRALAHFVTSSPKEGANVDIVDGEMAVQVTWKPGTRSIFNHRTSTVNEIFDADDNYIAAALREKAKQLRSPNFTGLKGVLLADIGSATLKSITGIDRLGRSASGERIIQRHLDKPDGGLDFVCVFSPQRETSSWIKDQRYWKVTAFFRNGLVLPLDGLSALAEQLPKPRFDGWQLEHLHEQRLFGENSRGWYLGSRLTSNMADQRMTFTFSSRALLEFLAGRLDGDRLRDNITGLTTAFEHQLARGRTIQSARIVPCGVDEDDDLIELTFAPDPAASPFEDRSQPKSRTSK